VTSFHFLLADVAQVHGLWNRFKAYPVVFLAMPVVAALIGYLTKLAAIKMMFDPIDYKGIGPFGWQGILPKRAAKMASVTVDLMLRDLVDPREFLDRIDPVEAVQELEGPFLEATDRVARQVLNELQPGLWDSLPERTRAAVLARVRRDAPGVLTTMLEDLKENLDEVFDLKHMIISNMIKDKELLNRIYRETAHKEFQFIARSGFWFGLAIGFLQALVFLAFPNPFVLPIFGLFIGYSTDWLALRMLFRPLLPTTVLGVTFQGAFIKRQPEVTEDYARLVAEEMITPRNVLESLLEGPYSDVLFQMINRNVTTIVDEQLGRGRQLTVLAIGSQRYVALKDAMTRELLAEIPRNIDQTAAYTERAFNVRQMVRDKILAMTPAQFEGLLRPAFQADEWIIVTVGAALGFLVGLTQDLLLVPLFSLAGPGPAALLGPLAGLAHFAL
jgi:uncharacterized membrane protein YheB (UPF0754 family)